MSKLLILGAGGHGKVVVDLALSVEQWEEISFLDSNKIGQQILGYTVIGGIEDYEKFRTAYTHAIVAIGDNKVRRTLTYKLIEAGYEVPILIHPSAVVSRFAQIDLGSIVLAEAVVHTSAQLGKAVIVNTGAIVEHECMIEDGVHLSPHVALGGGTKIREGAWIGIGASVIHNIEIGKRTIVGAGAVVINDLKEDSVAVGVPAQIRKGVET